jgi:allantoin racemase
MRLILVPPYRGAGYDFRPEDEPYYHEVIAQLRQARQLDGVEVDIDPGVHTEHVAASRDQSLFDHLAVAVQARVRAIAEAGSHDGVVVLGGIDVGFDGVRAVAPIPVAYPVHSALHMASLIGDRFSYLDTSDPQAARVRRLARSYGFDRKLIAVRNYGWSSTAASPVLRSAKVDGKLSVDAERLLDDVCSACVTAIENDQPDVLIVGFTPLQPLQAELRQRLDAAGYAEVPVIWLLTAAVAMVKAMVETGLRQSPRAFPTDALVARPAWR